MATMIPPIVSSTTPGSERRVFESLKSGAETGEWSILHSLGISSAWTGGYGEIDFVVIIPRLGIICVEVKGGTVTHKNGTWYTRRHGAPSPDQLKRSPFLQAQEGMWKLKSALATKFGHGSFEAKCPIGWMAILPDVDCPPITTEFTRAEVIDQSDMQQDISARIREAPSLVQLASRNDLCAPSAGTCKRILNFLRPDFDRVEMASASTWDAERRIKSLTEEQYDVLDAVAENEICLVKGPAGTGKTNIAIEAARRLSLSGRRVLLACFNRQLGAWLRKSLDDQGLTSVVSGHIHGLLRERISRSTLAGDLPNAGDAENSDLYGRLYFDLGALAIEETGERFDAIIIDETQDFEAARLFDIVQAWTQGVNDTKTILFGDFTRQALYGTTGREHPEVRAAFPGAAVFNLSINCRNTRRIATQTDLMCGFTGTKVSEKQVEGDPVEVFFESDQAGGLARLAQIVTALRAAGFRPADVVVLGPRRREHSLLCDSATVGGWRIKDMFNADADETFYSTIHAFKGLERAVVIVVDAGSANSDETDSLLYVAMTRARVRLYLLCPEDARPIINQRMMAGILAMAGAS
jgi:hypothetical protein